MKAPSPRVILWIGWIAFMLFAYPGYLDGPGAEALIDARLWTISDANSPMLSFVWRWIGLGISGPPGLLFLQATLTLLGAYHILRRVMSPRAAAITASVLLMFPPVAATVAQLCEDSAQVAFLLLGLVLLPSDRRPVKIGALVAFVVAAAMRPGGALAVLPIIVAGFSWRAELGGWKRYAIAAGAWIGIVVLSAGVQMVLVDRDPDARAGALAAFDITQVSTKAKILDDEWIFFQAAAAPRMPGESKPNDDLIDARRDLIRAHPGAYVKHRARMLLKVLGFYRGSKSKWQALYTKFVAYPVHRGSIAHAATHSRVQKAFISAIGWSSNGRLFRPYVYFGLALIFLPLALVRRQRAPAILLASGIAHELAIAVVTVQAQFRNSHWLVVSTLLAIALMIAQQVQARRAKQPA